MVKSKRYASDDTPGSVKTPHRISNYSPGDCVRHAFIFALFIASATPAWALFAYTADSYEKKPSAFDSISTIVLLPPKVVTGDYQLFHSEPVFEDTPAYELVAKSILLGSTTAFTERGYSVLDEPLPVKSEVWEIVKKFTDAPM